MKLTRSAAIIGFFLLGLSSALAGPNDFGTPQESREESPKRAFLGVELDRDEGPGVRVTRVIPKSSAETAGLQAGDRILGIGGTVTDTLEELLSAIGSQAAADSVQVVFRRDRELHVVLATLGGRALEPVAKSPAKLAMVLGVLRPRPGQVIADIGFGGGWLAVGLAEAVGPEGLVYAVEIKLSAVQKLQQREIPNIKAVHSKQDDVTLPERSLDLAVLHDVASHVSKQGRPAFYSSIERALKSSGHLTIFGPHGKARSMLDELAGYGFHAEDEAALDQLSVEELDARLAGGIRFFHRTDTER